MATDPADAASMAWTPAICSPLYLSYRVDGLARRSYSNAKQRALHFNSRNGRYGIFGRDRADYSALMPANVITLAHFSISAAMCLPKSVGGHRTVWRRGRQAAPASWDRTGPR